MSDVDIQVILGLTEKSPQIIMRVNAPIDEDNQIHSYFVSGGAVYPGRFRWVDTDHEDSDETKAAAIAAKLLE
jgi:hypothetical protein